MADTIVYAQLAERAYIADVPPLTQNEPLVPDGWIALHELSPTATGFQAGVYTNNQEIVIAFGGTSGAPFTDQNALNDWINNVLLGAGFNGGQLYEAARLYAEVARGDYGYSGLPITFAGHSLGGGLASLMTALLGCDLRLLPWRHSSLRCRQTMCSRL